LAIKGVSQAEGKIKFATVKSGEFNNWANYRLKGGVDALPEGLRLK